MDKVVDISPEQAMEIDEKDIGFEGLVRPMSSCPLVAFPVPNSGHYDFADTGHGPILHKQTKGTHEQWHQEDDKKRFECKTCGKMILGPRSSLTSHANRRHLKIPLYECSGCGKRRLNVSKTEATIHAKFYHHGAESLIISHRVKVRKQLEDATDACFPESKKGLQENNAPHSTNMCIFCPVPQQSSKAEMISCDSCVRKPRFQTIEMLEEHVSVQHFRFSPYQCRECPLFFGTEHAIVAHIRHFHGHQQFSFIVHYTPGSADIREQIKSQVIQGQKDIAPPPGQDPMAALVPPAVIPAISGPPMDPINSVTNVFVKQEPEEEEDVRTSELIIDEEKSKSTSSQKSQDMKPDITKLIEFNSFSPTPGATVPCTPIVTESTSVSTSSKIETPAPKIGPIDFAEFGHDSILQNADTLAELMKRSDDLNRQEDDRKRVECKTCGMMISDQRSSRFYHANTRHIKLPLYECIGCGKKWCTISRSDVVKHVQANHNGDKSLIIDHKQRVRQQLKVLVELCFPRTKKESAKEGAYTFDENDDFEEDEVRAAATPLGRKPPAKQPKYEEPDDDEDDSPPTMKKLRSLGGHTLRSMDIFKNC